MQRKTRISITVIVVILTASALYTVMKPNSAEAPVATGKYVESTACYEIVAAYATSTPLEKDADEPAVADMKQFVDDTIVRFKSDISSCSDQSLKADLRISYLSTSSAHTVSYMFTTYEDTGGAHGNMFYHTFTFDFKSGAPLKIADLFVPRALYLDTLSTISRVRLQNIIDKESFVKSMLDAGTVPEDKSFENFFLDGTSLVILFSPYAVAPYSAGPQTLAIPVSELKAILKPEYQ